MWYYKVEDDEVGPVNTEKLKQLIKERQITGTTLVRSAKGNQWKPLSERVKKKPKEVIDPSPKNDLPTNNLAEPSNVVTKVVNEPIDANTTPEPIQDIHNPIPTSNQKQTTPKKDSETQPLPFQFTGNGSEYFKIWMVNIVLSILTLGIYSAWAKVRRKQYFYGNTKVNDTSFNYLANPITILKGRIVLFVGVVIYSLVNQFYPLAGVAIMFCMLPLLPWLIVRALSFNARNSAARNISFTFKGTYFEAAKAYLFWPMLIPLTLGMIYPYVYYKQQKYLVGNSGFGTTDFTFTAKSGEYYKIFLKLLLPLIACVILSTVAHYFFPNSFIFIMIVLYLYSIAYISVKSTNLLYCSSKLAKHGFQSTMEVKPYLWIVITNTLATIITVGFFHPFAQVRAYKYQLDNLTLLASDDLDLFVADEKSNISALGDEAADYFDLDIGL